MQDKLLLLGWRMVQDEPNGGWAKEAPTCSRMASFYSMLLVWVGMC